MNVPGFQQMQTLPAAVKYCRANVTHISRSKFTLQKGALEGGGGGRMAQSVGPFGAILGPIQVAQSGQLSMKRGLPRPNFMAWLLCRKIDCTRCWKSDRFALLDLSTLYSTLEICHNLSKFAKVTCAVSSRKIQTAPLNSNCLVIIRVKWLHWHWVTS